MIRTLHALPLALTGALLPNPPTPQDSPRLSVARPNTESDFRAAILRALHGNQHEEPAPWVRGWSPPRAENPALTRSALAAIARIHAQLASAVPLTHFAELVDRELGMSGLPSSNPGNWPDILLQHDSAIVWRKAFREPRVGCGLSSFTPAELQEHDQITSKVPVMQACLNSRTMTWDEFNRSWATEARSVLGEQAPRSFHERASSAQYALQYLHATVIEGLSADYVALNVPHVYVVEPYRASHGEPSSPLSDEARSDIQALTTLGEEVYGERRQLRMLCPGLADEQFEATFRLRAIDLVTPRIPFSREHLFEQLVSGAAWAERMTVPLTIEY